MFKCNITKLPIAIKLKIFMIICSYCSSDWEYRIACELYYYYYRKGGYMEEKKFKCGYCGKEYDTPAARANCELFCDRKRIAEEEKAKQDKLKKEKEERKKKVLHLRQELIELEKMYYRDYGELVETLREPVVRTVTFDGDWGKYFEDVFGRIRW